MYDGDRDIMGICWGYHGYSNVYIYIYIYIYIINGDRMGYDGIMRSQA